MSDGLFFGSMLAMIAFITGNPGWAFLIFLIGAIVG